MSRRMERINEEIRGELARLLREEATDPRIGLVTITRVDVSPDLHNALVFYSPLELTEDRDDEPEAGAGLESAAPFLRRRLAQLLPLKRVPALQFRYDPSLAQGDRTLALLKEIEDGASG